MGHSGTSLLKFSNEKPSSTISSFSSAVPTCVKDGNDMKHGNHSSCSFVVDYQEANGIAENWSNLCSLQKHISLVEQTVYRKPWGSRQLWLTELFSLSSTFLCCRKGMSSKLDQPQHWYLTLLSIQFLLLCCLITAAASMFCDTAGVFLPSSGPKWQLDIHHSLCFSVSFSQLTRRIPNVGICV